jgi:hypothetical protein
MMEIERKIAGLGLALPAPPQGPSQCPGTLLLGSGAWEPRVHLRARTAAGGWVLPDRSARSEMKSRPRLRTRPRVSRPCPSSEVFSVSLVTWIGSPPGSVSLEWSIGSWISSAAERDQWVF